MHGVHEWVEIIDAYLHKSVYKWQNQERRQSKLREGRQHVFSNLVKTSLSLRGCFAIITDVLNDLQ